ncbi:MULTISPECIES: SDR family oxidoreductase [Niastella]|uniref:SDR family oxidoreductase n=1 Tax=Niastella soli TaxID=2821487 RepID=A0ABS3Z386_9BACT|nr:SDR family oxidoreductase [Niastella soli]MBO9204638.1 SDR family oxidoreductase [Niastella soli]
MNNKENKKVWFVTGASKGLGLALTKALLEAGYRVAATSRNQEQLISSTGVTSDRFLPLGVDLTAPLAVNKAIADTVQHFGRLDVIVNNAGYGMGGTVEEFSEQELIQSFDVNVFAPVYVMQAALPFLRSQKSGHIINISSIAGFAPATGWAIYAATKFALTGMTEVLAQDLKELNIHATVVAPGAFVPSSFLTIRWYLSKTASAIIVRYGPRTKNTGVCTVRKLAIRIKPLPHLLNWPKCLFRRPDCSLVRMLITGQKERSMI